MTVLPYATPVNGPHGSYMAHLWGSITGKGKKCKIMRAALKCVLQNHLPDDATRGCYLRHASQRQANLTQSLEHSGGACAWRPNPTEAGAHLLPRRRGAPELFGRWTQARFCRHNARRSLIS
jgi:hypothetical protein